MNVNLAPIAECRWDAEISLAALSSDETSDRIDYIFYDKSKLHCAECELVMGKIPGQSYSYSDHLGVSSTFQLLPSSSLSVMPSRKVSKSTAESALKCFEQSLRATHADTIQKRIMWVMLIFLWCGVVVAGFNLMPPVVVAVVASILSAAATTVFWYLAIFSRTERFKFSENAQEMLALIRSAE